MTDTTTPELDAPGTEGLTPTSTTPTPQDVASLPQWAQERIRRSDDDAAKRRIAAKEAEDKLKAEQEARMVEQNKWQELAEQRGKELDALRAAAAKAEAYEKQAAETLRKRIEALPEHVRGAVPEYDDPLKVMTWLDANAAVLSLPTPPPTDAGVRGVAVQNIRLTPEESALARLAGMTDEDYYKYKRKE